MICECHQAIAIFASECACGCHHTVSVHIVPGGQDMFGYATMRLRSSPLSVHLAAKTRCLCTSSLEGSIASGCAFSCRHTVYAECIVPERQHVYEMPRCGVRLGTSILVRYSGL